MEYKSVNKKERKENATFVWRSNWEQIALVVCRKDSTNPNMHPTGIVIETSHGVTLVGESKTEGKMGALYEFLDFATDGVFSKKIHINKMWDPEELASALKYIGVKKTYDDGLVIILERKRSTDSPKVDLNVANVNVYVDWSLYSSVKIGSTIYTQGTRNDRRDDTFNGNDTKTIAIPGGTDIVATGANGDRYWFFCMNGGGNHGIDHGVKVTFTVPSGTLGSGDLDFGYGYGDTKNYYVRFSGEWCSGWWLGSVDARVS